MFTKSSGTQILPPIHKFAEICYLLFVFFLFFPIRHVFPSFTNYITGSYSDFTSISLYISDIWLILATFFIILPRGGVTPRGRSSHHVVNPTWWIVIWLIFEVLYKFFHLTTLNLYFTAKLLELVVAYGTTKAILSKNPDFLQKLAKFFIFLASFQSILALGQFYTQHSIGLNKLGEPILNANIPGIAKIVAEGVKYIRGYGTFPHPNLLSAFLVTAILLSIWQIFRAKSPKNQGFYWILCTLNIFGLGVTFSRAAYLALAAGLAIFFLLLLYKQVELKKLLTPALAVLIVLLAVCAIFKPFLLTRATISDQATLQREFYAKVGIQIIKANPWLGLGAGESVLHMQQYSPVKLEWWQIQPIHNYFLLAAAELGIISVLILIWIFFWHLRGLVLKIKDSRLRTEPIALIAILISFLILMQFDHYFYTLQQTQMLLWIVLGIIAAEIQKPTKPDWVSDTVSVLQNEQIKNSLQQKEA